METNNALVKSLLEELLALTNNISVLSSDPDFYSTIAPAMEHCSWMLKEELDDAKISEMIRLIYPAIKCLSQMDNIPEDLMEKTAHLLEVLVNTSLNLKDTIKMLEEQNRSPEDFMVMQFQMYQNRKKENVLYSKTDLLPQMLIKEYYYIVDNPRFSNLFGEFKRQYILNENLVEQVHEPAERVGMATMYDYVQKLAEGTDFISIFTLQSLHARLYSKVPHPEFGGKFRNDVRYLPGSGFSLLPPDFIVPAFNDLFPKVLDLVERGRKLKVEKNTELILAYINDCIELNCILIKIHPFGDGNGRSVRAFTNLLFSLANIPPVYVREREKQEYGRAMNKALCFNGERRKVSSYDISLNDTTAIKKFYYYKICDSLIELDVKKRIKTFEKEYSLMLKL